MTRPALDLLTLGNAIVDLLAQTEESFLVAQAVHKGAMQLIDEPRAESLYGVMGPAIVVSGGSAANTAVGAAALGAKVGFVGKVKDDELGRLFRHDLGAVGVQFDTTAATDGPATARCFVLVTPDGERTMNTYLGACQNLTTADIDEDEVASAKVVYLEGYLWDPPAAKDAFRKAVAIAHRAGNQVALSLSDPFCVGRYRGEFRELIRDGSVDLLFANTHELMSLYEVQDEAAAFAALRAERVTGIVTRSAEGATVVNRDGILEVPAFPVSAVVDTTGAGDLFAAGYLAGLAHGLDPRGCARLGTLAAAEVIGHLGARPQGDLSAMARTEGMIA